MWVTFTETRCQRVRFPNSRYVTALLHLSRTGACSPLQGATSLCSRRGRSVLDRLAGGRDRRDGLSPPDLAHQPFGRVVELVGDALLEGDDRVVRDVDVYRADLGAALGDVAEAEAVVLLEVGEPIGLVHGVHLQPLVPDEEPRARELGVLVVRSKYVADVLAHKALYALLRFVEALDILLVHGEGS